MMFLIHPYRITARVRRSNDWQELVDQLEASVAAPSATPQTLLDAVAWNNTINDDPCVISCMSFWGERSVALMIEVSAVRGDLTNRLLLKLLSVCNHCTVFFRTFLPLAKKRGSFDADGELSARCCCCGFVAFAVPVGSNEMNFWCYKLAGSKR